MLELVAAVSCKVVTYPSYVCMNLNFIRRDLEWI